MKTLHFFLREVKVVLNRKRLAVLLLAVPLLITSFLAYLYQAENVVDLRLGALNYSSGSHSREIIRDFDSSSKFELVSTYTDEYQARSDMAEDLIDVMLIIPDDFDRKIKSGTHTDVYVVVNNTNMSVGSMSVLSAVQIIAEYTADVGVARIEAKGYTSEKALAYAQPVKMELRHYNNPTSSYKNFMIIGYGTAIMQIILFLCVSLAAVREKEDGLLDEIREKTKYGIPVILGKQLAYVLFSFAGWLFTFYAMTEIFHIPFRGNTESFLMLSLAFIWAVTAMGLCISTLFSQNSLNPLQYSMVIALPSYLICGYIWPFWSMPPLLAEAVKMLPYTYFGENIRGLMLEGRSIDLFINDIYVLSAMAVVFTVISMFAFQILYMRNKEETVS